MSRFTRSLALAALTILLGACRGREIPVASGFGTVNGRVVAGDGTTPIPGSVVRLASNPVDGPVDTTDVNGEYSLAMVPSGSQQLRATRGEFAGSVSVMVGVDMAVSAQNLRLLPTGNLAYVPGAFDHIEAIVGDSLGYSLTSLTSEQLGITSVTSQYRMIFVNCGADVNALLDDAAARDRLKAWVASGGILYASDLTLDLVQAMFPEHILSTASGDIQDATAAVESDALRRFIGKSSVALRYDLPGWMTPDQISATPEVLLRGSFVDYEGVTQSNKPLVIAIRHGEGTVIFTSFHNEAGVTADQLAVLRYFVYVE